MKEYEVTLQATIKAYTPEEAAEEMRHRLIKLMLCAGAPGYPLQFTVIDGEGGIGHHLTFVPEWK